MDARFARMKVAACFLVILLHISSQQALHFGAGWWAANILDSVSRVSVPIFLMISGALLLNKNEPISSFLTKRFSRVFPPLVFWSCFYLAWLTYNGVVNQNWISAILAGPTMYHLWYLYAIIGLYALVPLLRRFYQNSTFAEKLWVLSLWFIVGSLWPTLTVVNNPSSCVPISAPITAAVYHLTSFGGYAGFLILGAVIRDLKSDLKIGVSLFLGGSIVTAIMMFWHSGAVGQPCETFYNYSSPFVIIASAGFFMIFMSAKISLPSKLITIVADCTLGIYCLHVTIIGGIFPRFNIIAIGEHVWITAPLVSLAAFVASLFFIYLFRLTKLGRLFT